MLHSTIILLLATAQLARSHADHDQVPLGAFDAQGTPESPTWAEKYGPQIDQPFSGPLSFSHLPYARCLEDDSMNFDIALLGMPFDTGVTYRPGARFGPYAIRSGSRRQREARGYTLSWNNNPYTLGYKVMDCGDVCTDFLYYTGGSVLMHIIHFDRCPCLLSITRLPSTRWKWRTRLF